jgi:hypothetical protein
MPRKLLFRLGVIIASSALSIPGFASTYTPSWEQDRQSNEACSGYHVVGYRVSGTYADLSTFDGVQECMNETMPLSGPFRLEHVWVFQNVSSANYCVKFKGGNMTDSEEFGILWRAFTPGDESESFVYQRVDPGLSSGDSYHSFNNSDADGPFTCGIGTVSGPADIHLIISDFGGSGDTSRSQACIDQLVITNCTLAAGTCTGGDF